MIGFEEINCCIDESANSLMTVTLGGKLGRGMVAKQSFKQGEIIMAEPPLVIVSSEEAFTNPDVIAMANHYPSMGELLIIRYSICS